MYYKRRSVLQESACCLENCITIWWCSGLKIVLQYRGVQWKNCIAIHKCIVTRRCIAVGNELYCSLVEKFKQNGTKNFFKKMKLAKIKFLLINMI